MFSGRQTHRDKSQKSRSLDRGREGNQISRLLTKPSLRVVSKSSSRNNSERKVASKILAPKGRTCSHWVKAVWCVAKLTKAANHFWRGVSDSAMIRTHQATGEALLAPGRNPWSRSDL